MTVFGRTSDDHLTESLTLSSGHCELQVVSVE